MRFPPSSRWNMCSNLSTALPAGISVPPGRKKPWGTGHAVLCCADVVHEPFAVINADDFMDRKRSVCCRTGWKRREAPPRRNFVWRIYSEKHTHRKRLCLARRL